MSLDELQALLQEAAADRTPGRSCDVHRSCCDVYVCRYAYEVAETTSSVRPVASLASVPRSRRGRPASPVVQRIAEAAILRQCEELDS